jgi:CTP:molybdopterin cytidylyltransferase MocA
VTVAGLVLAAGAGRRFGGPKAIALLYGERLVDRAARLLRDGGCEPVLVISGAVPLDVPGARVIENAEWTSGMGSSLRIGLAAAEESNANAVIVALVDTPWVGVEAVRRLRAAQERGAVIAVATYDGAARHPVLLGRDVWDDAARLAVGDIGARALMVSRPDLVVDVPCDDTGDPRDVDVPADFTRSVVSRAARVDRRR